MHIGPTIPNVNPRPLIVAKICNSTVLNTSGFQGQLSHCQTNKITQIGEHRGHIL